METFGPWFLQVFLFLFNFVYLFLGDMAHMWCLENNLWKLVSSFYHMCPQGSNSSSGLTASNFICWAISLTPFLHIVSTPPFSTLNTCILDGLKVSHSSRMLCWFFHFFLFLYLVGSLQFHCLSCIIIEWIFHLQNFNFSHICISLVTT